MGLLIVSIKEGVLNGYTAAVTIQYSKLTTHE